MNKLFLGVLALVGIGNSYALEEVLNRYDFDLVSEEESGFSYEDYKSEDSKFSINWDKKAFKSATKQNLNAMANQLCVDNDLKLYSKTDPIFEDLDKDGKLYFSSASVVTCIENKDDDQNYIVEKAKYNPAKQFGKNLYKRIYNPADGENTKWQYTPVKAISYPLTKIQYEVVQQATSLVTESFSRSPLHNGLGTLEEAKKTLKLISNGLFDMLRGVVNPKNGAFVDGILGILSGGYNLTRVATGVVKTAASTVAYPTYRVFGGEKSQHEPLKGKRAVIVWVDSAVPLVNLVIDPYGDQIVRHHLNGIANYYCVVSPTDGSRSSCIDNIPYDTEYVDMVALTHSGGTRTMDYSVRDIVDKGFKPGLMLSIGCNDSDSTNTNAYNALGQEGYSWGVHYFISHTIAKRLRGISIQQASKHAFYEDLPINMINPVSLLGQLGVAAMLGDSIAGSYPDTRVEDSEDIKSHLQAMMYEANMNRVVKYAYLYQNGEISKTEFGKLMHLYEQTKESTLAYLASIKDRKNYGFISTVQFPRRIKYRVKIAGKIRSTRYKYL